MIQEFAGEGAIGAILAELSAGKVELPAIPDAAFRVGRALADDHIGAERIERIVSSEPVLAGRVIQLAGSAAFARSGQGVRDLREAIRRVGFGMVRVVCLAYSLGHMRNGGTRPDLSDRLNEVWSRSTLVASLSPVVARRLSAVNPETAMLAGLLHCVGELYLLTRTGADAVTWEASGRIGEAILARWGIDAEIGTAVAECSNVTRVHGGPVDLADILTISVILAACMHEPESLQKRLSDVAICRRIGIEGREYLDLMRASQPQIEAVRMALGY